MFLSAQDLAVRKIPVRTVFAPGDLDLLDPALRISAPIEVVAVAELRAGNEIRVSGTLAGEIEAGCDRCAEFFRVPVSGEFDLRYEPSENEPSQPEHAISPGDAEVGFYEGAGVELSAVIREQVLLSLPMRQLCGADCKGICPVCGQNRNTADCQCRVTRTDSRWEALGELAGT
ncbi:MAG: DUF177 domain-containing protein [Bryobacteraceae bacterium]